jgi:hypothetical protein
MALSSLIAWLKYSGATKADGTPVSSGRAWFYQPGTTDTQVQVYSTETDAVPLGQPVALDAAGRATVYAQAPVNVVVEEAVTNLVVSTSVRSNTVTSRQVDVLASTEMAAQSLASALDLLAQGVAYQESGGATPVPYVDAIGGGELTFQDFGATGDGTTDDTAAILATLFRQGQTKKAIRINPGTYNFSTSITITTPGAVIRGVNAVNCILRNTGNQNGITVNVPGADSGVLLENFTVIAVPATARTAVFLYVGDGTTIRGVRTFSHRKGFDTTDVDLAYLEDCTVRTTDGEASSIGFELGDRSTALRCRVHNTGTGRAFVIGSLSKTIHCHAYISANGFEFAGPASQALMCQATSCTNGYLFGAPDCQAVLSASALCANGFAVGAVARSGASFCGSIDASSADLLTAAGATAVVDNGNTFTTRTLAEAGGNAIMGSRGRVVTRSRTINTTAGPVVAGTPILWAPDPRLGELQVFVYNGNITGGDVNVHVESPPVVPPAASNGQSMRIVIANARTTGAHNLVASFESTMYWGQDGGAYKTIAPDNYITWHYVWWYGWGWLLLSETAGTFGAEGWLPA